MIKEPLLQIPANSQIFVLTGAGISKESGIQTFRDSDGLWNNHRIEDVAFPQKDSIETLLLSMISIIIEEKSSIQVLKQIRVILI